MTLPTRGLCHSVFLLACATRSKSLPSIDAWVAAARRSPTYMARALGIRAAADALVAMELAGVEAGCVRLDERIVNAGEEASTQTFAHIARIILDVSPPPWIHAAVVDGTVRAEFIPTATEEALDWLSDLRDPLLFAAKNENDQGEDFRDWLGSLGESLVAESERRSGRRVIQVSRISDYFGYDIQSDGSGGRRCIEVKTTLETAADRFFISKNEVSKA